MSNEWQPIETAPKDGTHILVYRPEYSNDVIGIDFWRRKCWWLSSSDSQPTHWMPLPEPPK